MSGGHFGYIGYIYFNKSLPTGDPSLVWCWGNPPLFHIISAIILRAYQLGEISYKKYMYLMNEMDKRGWLKKEPLEENIKATFFVLGTNVKKNPDILRRAYEEGHYIANHGYSHNYDKI